MTDTKAPHWMMDDDDERELELDEPGEAPPDKTALSYILGEALNDIQNVGGTERHRLTQVISRPVYDRLLERPAASRALDNWLEAASPKAKTSAGRVLAIQVAKVARSPELVGRIETELADAFDYGLDTGRRSQSTQKPPTTIQVRNHRQAVTQRRNGQRVAYEKPKGTNSIEIAELARLDDISRYRAARLRKEKRA